MHIILQKKDKWFVQKNDLKFFQLNLIKADRFTTVITVVSVIKSHFLTIQIIIMNSQILRKTS